MKERCCHKLHTIEGAYWPCSYLMEINMKLKDMFYYEMLTPEGKATFLHEYVHFLQDISLSSNLFAFDIAIRFLLSFTEILVENGHTVPQHIDLATYASENKNLKLAILNAEREIDSFINGLGKENELKVFNPAIVDEDILKEYILDFANTWNINEYSGCLSDEDLKRYTEICAFKCDGLQIYEDYIIGKNDIMESMASLIERGVYPEIEDVLPEYPYKVVEKVCKAVYPKINEIWQMVCICEVSLMAKNPGVYLYNLLTRMAEKDFLPKNPNDFVVFLKNENMYLELKEHTAIINKRINIAFDRLLNFYSDGIICDGLSLIKNRINSAYVIREKHFVFISYLVFFKYAPMDAAEPFLAYLFENLGTPMIVDNQKVIHNGVKDDAIFAYLGYFSLYVILQRYAFTQSEKEQKCFLCEFCKKHGQKEYNEEMCEKKPWLQAFKEGKVCVFGVIWHSHITSKV